MKEGMLWYDTHDESAVEERLNEAIDYFILKNGHPPLQCFVNPDTIKVEITVRETIKVVPNERILKNHFWLEFNKEKNTG